MRKALRCHVAQTGWVGAGGSYLARHRDRRDGCGSARGRSYRAQLPVQEDFLGTGVTPNPQRGQIHRQVVLRLLEKPGKKFDLVSSVPK